LCPKFGFVQGVQACDSDRVFQEKYVSPVSAARSKMAHLRQYNQCDATPFAEILDKLPCDWATSMISRSSKYAAKYQHNQQNNEVSRPHFGQPHEPSINETFKIC